jgi:hypothetical protein
MRLQLLSVCALAALNLGCATSFAEGLHSSEHDVSPFHNVPIDVTASEYEQLGNGKLTEHFDDGSAVSNALVKERQMLVDQLSGLFGVDNKSSTDKARVKLAYSTPGVSILPVFLPCLVVFSLLGCPYGHAEVMAELTIEVHGKVYAGRGVGTEWGSLFGASDDNLQLAHGRALGDALDDAVRNGPKPAGSGK